MVKRQAAGMAALFALSVASSAYAQGAGSGVTPRSGVVAIMANIDAHFICPEFLPDDAARTADLAAFNQSLSMIRPRPAATQIEHVRTMLIARHNCAQPAAIDVAPTPAPVSAAAQPVVVATAITPSGSALPN